MAKDKCRIEKLLMLEFGEDKRGWHVNAILNRPENIEEQAFFNEMQMLWYQTIFNDWQASSGELLDRASKTKMFWSESVADGFHSYAIKKRTETAQVRREVDEPNDLLILEASNIHSTQ